MEPSGADNQGSDRIWKSATREGFRQKVSNLQGGEYTGNNHNPLKRHMAIPLSTSDTMTHMAIDRRFLIKTASPGLLGPQSVSM